MDARTLIKATPAPRPATAVAPARPPAARSGPGRKRTAYLILALLALGLVGWLLFAPAPLGAELATVRTGPLQVAVSNQGQVRIHDKYVLAAPVAGRLARSPLDDGDPVRQGQVLATLYPAPMDPRQREQAQARLESARALAREAEMRVQRSASDLALAASERSRTERLVAEKFVSPQAMEKARSAEAAARAEADAARARSQAAMGDVRAAQAALIAADAAAEQRGQQPLPLTSPVDGYVLKVHEKSERIVAAGAPLVSVGNPADYEIVADVLSTDAVRIKPGQTMWLDDWGGGQSLRATVRLVEPVAFTKVSALGVEEQRVNVIATPVDALGPLGDGYRVEARVVTWEAERVRKVPGSSLFRVGEAWHVFAVEDGRIRERPVRVGQRNQEEAQVEGGLAEGAQVVKFPNNQMKDGMRVQALR
ncbi:efflux RND transporter periplasmic adaptor subunit|uniref:efflux RND transporter periplasmic adaptor subunit n=1 Tax=Noviherbaspirillum sp. L7-7A TaxID=2850560 RepID=UPI001C2BDE6B|nr:efflux RND transporter periplasmic adaptor subunit [Noviherbaspirillum sp. L7-7A]MBV0878750.1 efflux RND transporter periplasmic adaptor subunit [Noviherbaspirillum sp. L7-7A]